MMRVNKVSGRERDSLCTSQQSAVLLGIMKDFFIGGLLNKDIMKFMLLLGNAKRCLPDAGHNQNPNQ